MFERYLSNMLPIAFLLDYVGIHRMNRLQSQVQSHLSAVRQNTEKLLNQGHPKAIQSHPSASETNSMEPNAGTTMKLPGTSNPVPSNPVYNEPEKPRRKRRSIDQDFRGASRIHCKSTSRLSENSPLALEFPHRLFAPEHYESRYEYPLVIWLHSQDSSEFELDGVMPHLSLRNYVAVAPRAMRKSKVSDRKFCWSLSSSGFADAESLVMHTVAHAINDLSVNPNCVFLAGYGIGGTLAQAIGLKNSRSIAGVVSINGVFPHRSRINYHRDRCSNLPVLFIHGGESSLCDTDQTCLALQAAHRSGLAYQFNQFPCGDELNSAMTSVANQFIMKIVTS